MGYVELHARSAFSFLRGASTPEALVEACLHMDVPAMAMCERNGIYSAVRGHLAAKENGLRHIVGAEVALDGGEVVPLLVASQQGYRNLCRLLTVGKLRSEKGECAVNWSELAQHADGLFALTGDSDGPVRQAWQRGDRAGMEGAVKKLSEIFPGRLHMEIQRHRIRDEDIEEQALIDLARANRLSAAERHTLSSAGALNELAGTRRQALWESAKADLEFDLFASAETNDGSDALITPMNIVERIKMDFESVGLTSGDHPMKHLRVNFPDLWRADELPLIANGTRVRVGGSVICRQRPGTAKGFVFVSLEDESGVANAIVRPDLFESSRLVITQNPALIIEGIMQAQDGVIHVKAERITLLRTADLPIQASHDFH